MVIATSLGSTFDTEGQFHAHQWDPESYDNNVIDPDTTLDLNSQDQNEVKPQRLYVSPDTTKPQEIADKTASTMPLGSSTEPAGALKSDSGTGVARAANPSPELPNIEDVPHHDWIEGAISSLVDAFKAPGDAFQGKLDPNTPEGQERMFNMAASLMGAPAAIAEKAGAGTLGSFAGVRSATIPKADLYRAQNMELEGVHPYDIWQHTGFERGSDGRWRYEIPDENSKLGKGFTHTITPATEGSTGMWDIGGREAEHTVTLKHAQNELAPITDILNHPELYKAYPHLKDLMVAHLPDDLVKNNIKGMMDNEAGVMYLAPDLNPEYAKNVLLHEIQHSIQGYEGFSGGESYRSYMGQHDVAKNIYDKAISAGADPKHPNMIQARDLIQKEFNRAMELYRRTRGEVEARNVQTRMNFNVAQRGIPPHVTEDRPRFVQRNSLLDSGDNKAYMAGDVIQFRRGANDNMTGSERAKEFMNDLPKYNQDERDDIKKLLDKAFEEQNKPSE